MKGQKHKLLSVFLSFCMIISCMAGMSLTASAASSGTFVDGDGDGYFNWTMDDDGNMTISGDGVFPNSSIVENHDVKSIVFDENCAITKIEDHSMAFCNNLTSIVVNSTVPIEIDQDTFMGCLVPTNLSIVINAPEVSLTGRNPWYDYQSTLNITIQTDKLTVEIAAAMPHFDDKHSVAYPENSYLHKPAGKHFEGDMADMWQKQYDDAIAMGDYQWADDIVQEAIDDGCTVTDTQESTEKITSANVQQVFGYAKTSTSGGYVAPAEETEPLFTFTSTDDYCDLKDISTVVNDNLGKIVKIEAIIDSEEKTWALIQCGYWEEIEGEWVAHTFSSNITTKPGTNKIVAEGEAIPAAYVAQVMHHGAGKLLWAKVYFNDNTSVELGEWKAVTNVQLTPSTLELGEGETAVLNASITPNDATIQKVQWSVANDNVKLYSDEQCTTEVGTEPTDALTVYVKGIYGDSDTVTVKSDAVSDKSASCSVTIDAPPAPLKPLKEFTETDIVYQFSDYISGNVANITKIEALIEFETDDAMSWGLIQTGDAEGETQEAFSYDKLPGNVKFTYEKTRPTAAYAQVLMQGTGKLWAVMVSYADSTTESLGDWKIPEFSVPKGIIALTGQTLEDVALPDNFFWEDPTTSVGDAGEKTFKAIYDDTEHYPAGDINVPVTVVAPAHVHNWTYAADGATITATCTGEGTCDITEGLTMTISAPEGAIVYDGYAKTATLNNDYDKTAFPGEYPISYYKGKTALNGAPIDPGTYTAKVTAGEAVASVEFTIAKAPIRIKMADCESRVYNGLDTVDVLELWIDSYVLGDEVFVYTKYVTGKIESAEIGEYYYVTLPKGLKLGGADSSKYTLIQPTEPVDTFVEISDPTEEDEKPVVKAKPGDGTVTLSWNPVTNADRYAAYFYDPVEETTTVIAGNIKATEYTVKGLTNGETYYFLVRARKTKWTPYDENDIVCVILPNDRPVVTVTPGNKTATLEWDAVEGAEKYAAYLVQEDNTLKALATKITDTTYTVKKLTIGETYTFLVRAFVYGKWSEYTEADFVECRIPSGSPIVTATPGDTTATLSWKAINDATKYAAYIEQEDGTMKCIASKITDTTYTVKKLTNGETYRFLVRAYANGTWTKYAKSDIVECTPVSKAPVPTATPGDKKVTLSWDAVEGAEKYAAYTVDAEGNLTILNSKLTDTTYTAKKLTNGTEYTFLVRAYVDGKWTTYTEANFVKATPGIPN